MWWRSYTVQEKDWDAIKFTSFHFSCHEFLNVYNNSFFIDQHKIFELADSQDLSLHIYLPTLKYIAMVKHAGNDMFNNLKKSFYQNKCISSIRLHPLPLHKIPLFCKNNRLVFVTHCWAIHGPTKFTLKLLSKCKAKVNYVKRAVSRMPLMDIYIGHETPNKENKNILVITSWRSHWDDNIIKCILSITVIEYQ